MCVCVCVQSQAEVLSLPPNCFDFWIKRFLLYVSSGVPFVGLFAYYYIARRSIFFGTCAEFYWTYLFPVQLDSFGTLFYPNINSSYSKYTVLLCLKMFSFYMFPYCLHWLSIYLLFVFPTVYLINMHVLCYTLCLSFYIIQWSIGCHSHTKAPLYSPGWSLQQVQGEIEQISYLSITETLPFYCV